MSEMISTVIIEIAQQEKRLVYSSGSILHGFLMECLDPEIVRQLHESRLNPFSSALLADRISDVAIWKISSLNNASYELILKPLVEKLAKEKTIVLKQKLASFEVKNIYHADAVSYEDLSRKHFISDTVGRRCRIRFATPAAFKSSGRYVFMPEIRLIMNSLINRWNAFSGCIKLEDEHLLDHICEHVAIAGYNIRSCRFGIEGTTVPGLIGSVDFKTHGPDALARLASMLFDYSVYAGVGIKTALGMGCVEIDQKNNNPSICI